LVRNAEQIKKSRNLSIRVGDICDKASLQRSLEGITGIIHLAAVICARTKKDYYDVNVGGTQNLISTCFEKNIKRFILVSSLSVKLSNLGDYEKSKIIAEEQIRNSRLDWTILRPGIIYGKGEKRNLGKIVEYLRALPVFPVMGKGDFYLQPLWVEDLARVIDIVREKNACFKKTYELGGDTKILYIDMIKTMMKIITREIPILFIPEFVVRMCLPVVKLLSFRLACSLEGNLKQEEGLVPDMKLAKDDFGFSPHSFEHGLRASF